MLKVPAFCLQACPLCSLEALSASGSCMPGVYSLTYFVTNDEGISATAMRQLYVYQAVSITVPLELYSGVTSYTQALQLVAGLSNSTLPAYSTGVDDVIAKLGSLADQVEPGDVDITAAAYVQLGPSSYSVRVNATVYLYSPRGVHSRTYVALRNQGRSVHRRQVPMPALPSAICCGRSRSVHITRRISTGRRSQRLCCMARCQAGCLPLHTAMLASAGWLHCMAPHLVGWQGLQCGTPMPTLLNPVRSPISARLQGKPWKNCMNPSTC